MSHAPRHHLADAPTSESPEYTRHAKKHNQRSTINQAQSHISHEERTGNIKDFSEEPSHRSNRLTRSKQLHEMRHGDFIWVDHNTTIGPINDMYIAMREFSGFPFGIGKAALIHNTFTNLK